jgi:hypothetical protein
MLIQAAKLLRWLGNRGVLRAELESIDRDQRDTFRTVDPFLGAALCEAISLVSRTSLRVAREAARVVDPYWLDVETPEELWLLFDND